ncbi:DUF3461 family protein [Leucothrix pacifica]|uniref:DUF3461 domain-containing protein n=1 Tax=Leucothrix pacifica TaxID=1247513 RepID=A0A317CPY3_9GAMM|nr:DUF3461 family protein [Leucothrix pacifica]PWR00152.1 DUF3461 domain-containing protein [Leucothrix pacifica]
MSSYPTLAEMDISRAGEIRHYTLHQEGKGDVLKIFYKRKKGSFLPERKTFRFGRSAKMIATGDRNQESREVYEISPFLLKAVSELDRLLKAQDSVVDKKQHIIDRMEQIEQEIKSAHEEMRSLLKEL